MMKIILSLIVLAPLSFGIIQVDVTSQRKVTEYPSDRTKSLEELILCGDLDKYEIVFKGKPISSDDFRGLSRSEQEVRLNFLLDKENANPANRKLLKATIQTKENDFSEEPLFPRLGIVLESLKEIVGAEDLLSAYAKKWAYKYSQFNGPNCYHTSISAIFLNWNKHRYMGPSEFKCHLKTYFEEIPKLEKWGDLIGIFTKSGTPIHGFTYLGPDRKSPKDIIVFTKNGYAQSRYLFMTYSDVYRIYGGPSTQVKLYRPIAMAVDPSDHSGAPCSKSIVNSPGDEPTLELPNADLLVP